MHEPLPPELARLGDKLAAATAERPRRAPPPDRAQARRGHVGAALITLAA